MRVGEQRSPLKYNDYTFGHFILGAQFNNNNNNNNKTLKFSPHFSDQACVYDTQKNCHQGMDNLRTQNCGAGNDKNQALPDTSMKLGRYVH